jgi:simple sugar transport system permease protein
MTWHWHRPRLAPLGWACVGLLSYALLVGIYGKNPLSALHAIWTSTLTSSYGLQDVAVRMIPLLFCAMAVAIPARVLAVNVGGEGQLFIGGITSAWVALHFTSWPMWALLPAMALGGALGGGVWGGIAGWMKTRGWMSEVFSTVLLNYVAILAVNALVYGPWRDPTSSNYPQTRELVPAARLPHFGASRVDISIVLAVAVVVGFGIFLRRTRWGLEMRAIGSNPYAAERNGVPIARYVIVALFVGGALAGLAGMTQLSALQFRLNPGISPPVGFGYLGFLISWLAGHDMKLIIPMTFLLAVLFSSGDILQITQGLPAATVTVLSSILMLVVLLARARRTAR